MKLVTLIENTTASPALAAEHGLSLYIETARHKILFDAGQSAAFADNAVKLGIDLAAVDFAVLSHGHYDHGGGMARFLELNSHAQVYVNQNAFAPHFNGTQKYIGLDPELEKSGRLVFTGDEHTIAPGVCLHTCNTLARPWPTDPFGLTERAGEAFVPDDFRHEQYLLLEKDGKRVLVSGCSHKGILNIHHWFRPDVLIGGFHFKQLPPDSPGLRRAAEILAQSETVFYTGHCTGDEQFRAMKEVMGDRLRTISTGCILEI